MNKYLANLNRIEFVVTSCCTGNCLHCSQGRHDTADTIDKSIAAGVVRKIASQYKIDSVMTFGGEALLFPKTVYEIHKAAKDMNIPVRQLITNGYFSNDTNTICSVAKELADCGVNEILLSADAFHQETIPIEYVKVFASEIIKNNIQIRLNPAWLISSVDDNIYNKKTKEILSVFNRMNIKTGEGNIVFPAGNALEHLGEYFDLSKPFENPYEENPADVRAICFGADGNIFGNNIYEKDILEILESYEPPKK